MITLYGTGVCKGFGIAEAVILSDDGGLSSLPGNMLRRGLEAIRRGERENEFPAVAVVCSSLDSGLRARLPGLRIAAVVAELSEASATECEWPSVIGVEDLLRSVEGGEIVVVDGTHGAVYVDPDAETLMHYQTMEDNTKTRRVFLGSAHLPAVTQHGLTVSVLATIADLAEASPALSEGADGLVLTASVVAALNNDDWAQLLHLLGGKTLVLLGLPKPGSLRDIVFAALPLQVAIAVPADESDRLADLRESISDISEELTSEDLEPAEIVFAVVAAAGSPYEDGYMAVPASHVVVDARVCEIADTQAALADCVATTLASAIPDHSGTREASERIAQRVASTVILDSSIDSVRYLAAAGVDSVAVPPGLVSATKDLIRSIPASE